MLNVDEASRVLRLSHPEKKITGAIDYDSDWFLFATVDAGAKEEDYNNLFYAVNKRSGTVRVYFPMTDLENYTKAVKERSLSFS